MHSYSRPNETKFRLISYGPNGRSVTSMGTMGERLPFLPDSVREAIMISSCPSVCSSDSELILLPHIIKGSSNVDETGRKYSLAQTDAGGEP